MTYAESLQIGAIFEIFGVSLLGCALPQIIAYMQVKSVNYNTISNKNEHTAIEEVLNGSIFRTARAFSAGIIIGVAMMHLLAEVAEADILGNGYPMTFAIALLAIMMMIGFEQFSIYAMTLLSQKSLGISSSSTLTKEVQLKDIGINGHDHGHNHGHDHGHTDIEDQHEHSCEHGHTHAHSLHLIVDKDMNKAVVKAIIMESSIAVHSIIIGFNLGLLESGDVVTIQALMIAYAFHQFFEGISLGTAFLMGKFSKPTTLLFTIFFSLTLPVGIMIGITTSSMSTTESKIKDIASSFAAGALIYNGLVELAGEEFSDPSLEKKPLLKFLMLIALFLGGFFMALLAYWA